MRLNNNNNNKLIHSSMGTSVAAAAVAGAVDVAVGGERAALRKKTSLFSSCFFCVFSPNKTEGWTLDCKELSIKHCQVF